jgi:hypothetical protein
MGTSQSSNGAPPNVPMIPPWADNGDSDNPPSPTDDNTDDNSPTPNPPEKDNPENPVLAPSGRFRGARTNLNKFAREGGRQNLRRGVGHYVKTGYGGSKTATARLSRTVATAGALYRALSYGSSEAAFSESSASVPDIDFDALRGKSFEQISDTIIEAIRPIDGDLDSEASRNSMKNAFSELLEKYNDANLFNLDEKQRQFVIERFIAGDVFARFDLDMGKNIRHNASSLASGLSRLKEAKVYIKETVASSFKKIASSITSKSIVSLIRETLEDAFHVFESYAL